MNSQILRCTINPKAPPKNVMASRESSATPASSASATPTPARTATPTELSVAKENAPSIQTVKPNVAAMSSRPISAGGPQPEAHPLNACVRIATTERPASAANFNLARPASGRTRTMATHHTDRAPLRVVGQSGNLPAPEPKLGQPAPSVASSRSSSISLAPPSQQSTAPSTPTAGSGNMAQLLGKGVEQLKLSQRFEAKREQRCARDNMRGASLSFGGSAADKTATTAHHKTAPPTEIKHKGEEWSAFRPVRTPRQQQSSYNFLSEGNGANYTTSTKSSSSAAKSLGASSAGPIPTAGKIDSQPTSARATSARPTPRHLASTALW